MMLLLVKIAETLLLSGHCFFLAARPIGLLRILILGSLGIKSSFVNEFKCTAFQFVELVKGFLMQGVLSSQIRVATIEVLPFT